MAYQDFNQADRVRSVGALSDQTFDLLVIGGGITGAGVARDAALRSLSVCLLYTSPSPRDISGSRMPSSA